MMGHAQNDLSRSYAKPALFYFLAVGARIKFNTSRFADYKEQVVDLLKRVTTVSVGTMEVVKRMEGGVH